MGKKSRKSRNKKSGPGSGDSNTTGPSKTLEDPLVAAAMTVSHETDNPSEATTDNGNAISTRNVYNDDDGVSLQQATDGNHNNDHNPVTSKEQSVQQDEAIPDFDPNTLPVSESSQLMSTQDGPEPVSSDVHDKVLNVDDAHVEGTNADMMNVNEDAVKELETDADNEKDQGQGVSACVEPRPLVIAGPSGAGKGTLIDMLRKRFSGDQFGFSVSHTTRQPREGEVDGVHYNFSTVEQMKMEIEAGKFIEYANVHGNYYGTSFSAVTSVQSKGQVCILDIDVQGVQIVKSSTLDPYYIFIAPPSMEALERRLRGRGTESEENILKRLANAKGEMEYGQGEGNFDVYLVNDDLNEAAMALCATVMKWYPFLKQAPESQYASNSISTSTPEEVDMPEDEAMDDISEAKTEVIDNTEDSMTNTLDEARDDVREEIVESLASCSFNNEEYPDDEPQGGDENNPTDSATPSDDYGANLESVAVLSESNVEVIDVVVSTEGMEVDEKISQKQECIKEEQNVDIEDAIDSVPKAAVDTKEEITMETEGVKDTKEVDTSKNTDQLPDAVHVSDEHHGAACSTEVQQDLMLDGKVGTFYTLQELKVPIDGVDWASREDYLSDEDIVKYFGMTRAELKALPKWKRQAAKKSLGIF